MKDLKANENENDDEIGEDSDIELLTYANNSNKII